MCHRKFSPVMSIGQSVCLLRWHKNAPIKCLCSFKKAEIPCPLAGSGKQKANECGESSAVSQDRTSDEYLLACLKKEKNTPLLQMERHTSNSSDSLAGCIALLWNPAGAAPPSKPQQVAVPTVAAGIHTEESERRWFP
jgi:hypothetical protein